jgi:hypothetical protein
VVSASFGIEDVKDALAGRAAGLEDLVELVQAFDGVVEELEQEEEGGEIAGLNL